MHDSGGEQREENGFMKTSARTEGDVMVVSLQGKIISSQDTADLHGEIRKAIENSIHKVVLDMAGMDWMNSTGLGAIVAVSGRLKNADGTLKLAAMNETVSNLFQLNKLNLIFEIHPTVAAAVASFK
ncbi:anti-sigma factor antagonist [candidate division KSB1 bacterium]|nr:MAG: anti-sigma factor antagonist [candidate division KSB1 bacterium]